MIITFLFTLMSLFPPPNHLAVIGDTQANPKIFLKAIPQMNKSPTKIFIHLGDQQGYGNYKRFKRFKARFDLLRWPRFIVPGNHDIEGINRKIWMKRWQKKKIWMMVPCFPYRCLLLDTASSRPPKEQWPWLEEQLKKPEDVLLFIHRPLPIPWRYWPKFYDRLDPIPCVKSNCKMWKLFLTYKKKIKAVFHGHLHAYKIYKLRGVPIYCSGGGGGFLSVSRRKGGFYHWLLVQLKPFKVWVKRL